MNTKFEWFTESHTDSEYGGKNWKEVIWPLEFTLAAYQVFIKGWLTCTKEKKAGICLGEMGIEYENWVLWLGQHVAEHGACSGC